MIASDVLLLNSSAAVTATVPWIKVKEFYIRIPGTYRVKFDLKVVGAGMPNGRIYLNGVAYGTIRNATGTWATWSEDLRVDDGDLLQLYLNETAAATVYARRLKLLGTVKIGAGVENAV